MSTKNNFLTKKLWNMCFIDYKIFIFFRDNSWLIDERWLSNILSQQWNEDDNTLSFHENIIDRNHISLFINIHKHSLHVPTLICDISIHSIKMLIQHIVLKVFSTTVLKWFICQTSTVVRNIYFKLAINF